MDRLGSVLLSSFTTLALRERIAYDSVRRNWHTLCGEPLCFHTFPSDLRGGVLTLNVDSPLWLRQVTLLRGPLRDRLQAYEVTEVRARLGRVSPPDRRDAEKTGPGETPGELSSEDAAWLRDAVSGIGDGDLREVLAKAMARSLVRASCGRRSDD